MPGSVRLYSGRTKRVPQYSVRKLLMSVAMHVQTIFQQRPVARHLSGQAQAREYISTCFLFNICPRGSSDSLRSDASILSDVGLKCPANRHNGPPSRLILFETFLILRIAQGILQHIQALNAELTVVTVLPAHRTMRRSLGA